MQNASQCYKTNEGKQKGAILYIVAASLIVLIGFVGLAIDLGHAYNNKSQLQNMADSCALAGATALDGTSVGIQEATNRARDSLNRLNNKSEFNNKSLSLAESDISFSVTLNNPNYLDKTAAQAIASTIRYVRAAIPPQQSAVFFAKIIPGIPSSLNVNAEAVAGQQPQTKVCNGLGPFSPVRRDIPYPPPPGAVEDPTGNYGFVYGQFYTLRQPGGNSGNSSDECAANGISGSQTGNFGLADPQNCGTNTPCFRDTVVNGSNGNCVSLGNDLPDITGNRGTNVQNALQTRFYQDGDTTLREPYSTYIANIANNSNPYRRIIPVGINDGNIPQGQGYYNVVGYGCFYMPVPPSATPPSSAICLQFVGACDESGRPSGTGGGTSITRIVLFR